MLLGVLDAIAIFYYWTWFVWPFVFVFSLVYSIIGAKDKDTGIGPVLVASVSLLIILAGITSPLMRM